MRSLGSIHKAAAAGVLLLVLASPAASFAHDRGRERGPQHQISPEQRAQWAKQHLDKEAAMLEIKASQQSAWDAYSAAALEMMTAFGNGKPALPDADAAAAMRQRAERATAMAQKLTKLADATASLQAVLDADQRKVLDRAVRMHSQFGDRHHHDGMAGREHWQHGSAMNPGMPKSSPKAAMPATPKN